MNPNYTFEDLSETVRVCVSPEHRFGTDAFLLASFAAPRRKDVVCDLGTGCGIIPLVMMKNSRPAKVVGVELQKQAEEQFRLSIAESRLETSIFSVCTDIRKIADKSETSLLLEPGSFDIVTCNPPYKAGNSGILSDSAADQIARHETMCSIGDVCTAASRLLRFSGRLCLCQRPERLCDVMTAMRAAGIEPKRLRFVAKTPADPPWLFLIEGKKGSKPFMKVEPLLSVLDGNNFSRELMQIYRGKEE